MIEVFKIDGKHQLRSFRQCLMTLVITMVGVSIAYFVDGAENNQFLIIGFLFWVFTSVAMTLPFHIQYLISNWDTILIVDNENKAIEIVESGKSYNISFSDLKAVRHILGHYRLDRTKSHIPIPFDYYGYIHIQTNEGKNLYITSLMVDPFKSPIPIEKTEYRFPFI